MTCGKFDPSLGKLTDVAFFLPIFGNLQSGFITLADVGAADVDAPFSIPLIDLRATFGPYPNGQTSLVRGPLTLAGSASTIGAGASVTYGVSQYLSFGGSPSYIELTGSAIQSVVGNGVFTIPITLTSSDISAQYLHGAPINVKDYAISFSYYGPSGLAVPGQQGTVLYTFDPAADLAAVPEPSTWGLLTCAAGLAVAVRRRRH